MSPDPKQGYREYRILGLQGYREYRILELQGYREYRILGLQGYRECMNTGNKLNQEMQRYWE